MRKSNLVKAMACFMAATMAITCVPSTNVTNGVSIVAEAATAEAVTDMEQIANFEFGTNGLTDSISKEKATLTGDRSNKDPEKTEALFTNDGALNLDGTYGIKLPASAVPKGKKYTISYTVKVNTSTQYSAQVYLHDKNDVNNYINIGRGHRPEGEFMVWSHLVDGEQWGDSTGATQSVNEWHTYDIKVDGTSITVYCDGKQQSSDENCKYINDGNSDLYIGVNAFDTPFNGEIKNLAIYEEPVKENPCKDISFDGEDTIRVLGIPFDLTATITGEKEADRVSQIPTVSSIYAATCTETGTFNGYKYTLKVTPTVATNGSISVKCGDIEKPYSFKIVDNKVTGLVSSKGSSFTATADQETSFVITANADYPDLPVKDVIELSTCSALSYKVDSSSSAANTKGTAITVYAKIKEGINNFEFKCGNIIFPVTVTGIKGNGGSSINGGTTTPSTPDTTTPDDTNKPDDTTPDDTNKPDDTTPDDTNKPGDSNTSNDNTNTPSDNDSSDNNTDNSSTTTTTKKKASIKSATAKKGKKVVSGTIKLSSGKVVKKATVKVYVNSKKKATVTTTSKGKFSAKLSKKLKKGDKVKIVVTKTTIKKITKTITVK